MDLLGEDPELSLTEESWRIYSRHTAQPPQYISKKAVVKNSSITAGSEIYGTVINSVLGAGVYVGKDAVVEDSVLMNGVTVKDGAAVRYAILDENVTIGENCTVGEDRKTAEGIAVVGAGIEIPAEKKIPAGAMISEE